MDRKGLKGSSTWEGPSPRGGGTPLILVELPLAPSPFPSLPPT